MTVGRGLGRHLPLAAGAQLQALLHRSVHQPERHLDDDDRPDPAGARHDRVRGDARNPGRLPVRAGAGSRRLDRRRRRSGRQATTALPDPGRSHDPVAASSVWSSLTGNATVGRILILATVQGVLTAFDNPVRRSFVTEMVPPEHVANAVSLNSAIMTGSRVVGPALAGVLIGAFGYAWCFFLDSFSYIAVLAGIAMMRKSELFPSVKAERAQGQVRAGLRYVRRNQDLFVPMVMMAIIGTLAFNFSVSTPLLITGALGGSQQAFTLFFSCMSFGALLVALATARRREIPRSHLVVSAAVFGAAMCALAASPALWVTYPLGFLVGMGSVGFMTSCNAILQLEAAPALPRPGLGAPGHGVPGQHPDRRTAHRVGRRHASGIGSRFLIGGIACFAAAALGAPGLAAAATRSRSRRR